MISARSARRVALAALAAGAVGTAGLGLALGAQAAAPTSSPSASASASPGADGHHRHPLLRAAHRDLLRHGGATGTVTSVDGSTLVVTGPKGKARTYDLTSSTNVVVFHGGHQHEAGSLTDVTTGEHVLVRAAKKDSSGNRDAAAVWVLPAKGASSAPSGS